MNPTNVFELKVPHSRGRFALEVLDADRALGAEVIEHRERGTDYCITLGIADGQTDADIREVIWASGISWCVTHKLNRRELIQLGVIDEQYTDAPVRASQK